MRAFILLPLVALGLLVGALVLREATRAPEASASVGEPSPTSGIAPSSDERAAGQQAGATPPAPSGASASTARGDDAELVDEGSTADADASASATPLEPQRPPPTHREELAGGWIRERSRRFADELALAPGSEQRIADILLEADRRMERVRQEARALGRSAVDRAELRAAADEVRAWRDDAFAGEFGPELGARLVELEDAPTSLGNASDEPPSVETEAGQDSPR